MGSSRSVLSVCLSTSLVFGTAVLSTRARGQQEDPIRVQARQLAAEGIDAHQAQDFATAEDKLERAYRMFPAPTLGLWSARTRVRLKRLVEAAERYEETSRMTAAVGDSETQMQAQRDAVQELAALVPRIPTLSVQVEPASSADAAITLDGSALSSAQVSAPFRTNPGKHTLVATRGSERVELVVVLSEKEKHTALLKLAPQVAKVASPPPPPPGPHLTIPAPPPNLGPLAAETRTGARDARALLKPVGIAALAVGGVSTIIWVASSIAAGSKLDDCLEFKSEYWCETNSYASAYQTAKTISTVSFWTGVVLLGAGTTALLVDAHSTEQVGPSVSLKVGPTGASVRGTF